MISPLSGVFRVGFGAGFFVACIVWDTLMLAVAIALGVIAHVNWQSSYDTACIVTLCIVLIASVLAAIANIFTASEWMMTRSRLDA